MADHQHHGHHEHGHHHGHGHAAPDSVKDPVCGMTVDPATAKYSASHAGTRYYFCSDRCRHRFTAEHDTPGAMTTPPPEMDTP